MTITLRINGLSEATGTLKGIMPHLTDKTILGLSQVAYDEAQRGAARHTKPGGSGALFQSLFNRAVPGGRQVGHDLDRAPQALWVNLGTKPHVIMPKAKKALRWSAGGRFFFAGKVNHPGYRGDAYIINAATLAVQQFARILDTQFKGVP
jgi:hypothetical protein